MRKFVFASFLALTLLGGGLALTLPSGWVDLGAGWWRDPDSACALRQQTFDIKFAPLGSAQAALNFGSRLENALRKGGVTDIVTQSAPQASGWGALASYTYTQGGVNYEVLQLYTSQGGKLRTVTGSNAKGEASACVNTLRELLKGRG